MVFDLKPESHVCGPNEDPSFTSHVASERSRTTDPTLLVLRRLFQGRS